MLRESRENERKTLATPDREVVFFIESNGERCPFHKVKDVSVSGHRPLRRGLSCHHDAPIRLVSSPSS
ncbi:MAG: hypothetical protein P8079_02345 [Gammaproteobacteria bacterium]